jgi:hypothetical protein
LEDFRSHCRLPETKHACALMNQGAPRMHSYMVPASIRSWQSPFKPRILVPPVHLLPLDETLHIHNLQGLRNRYTGGPRHCQVAVPCLPSACVEKGPAHKPQVHSSSRGNSVPAAAAACRCGLCHRSYVLCTKHRWFKHILASTGRVALAVHNSCKHSQQSQH